MHQQQLAMLAQQQTLLMAAAAKSGGVDPKYLASLQQQSLLMAAAAKSASGDSKNPAGIQKPGSNIPVQSWPAAGYPVPGIMPMGNQEELQKLMQVNYSWKHQVN